MTCPSFLSSDAFFNCTTSHTVHTTTLGALINIVTGGAFGENHAEFDSVPRGGTVIGGLNLLGRQTAVGCSEAEQKTLRRKASDSTDNQARQWESGRKCSMPSNYHFGIREWRQLVGNGSEFAGHGILSTYKRNPESRTAVQPEGPVVSTHSSPGSLRSCRPIGC